MTSPSVGGGLELKLLPRRPEIGDYDWFDIESRGNQVGKSRCRIESDRLTIFSIMIYPEYEGKGFARAVIDYFKTQNQAIIADRVRFTAREFWLKVGFLPLDNGNYIWRRPSGEIL